MNKLAALAFAAFATLGALMWYAASQSMDQYLTEYQVTINQQLPEGSEFSLSDLSTKAAEDSGFIGSVKLLLPIENTDELLAIQLTNISWQYEKRSLKKAVVQVTQMTIGDATVLLPQQGAQQALANLTTQLDTLVKPALERQLGLMGRSEFQLNINKLMLDKLFITLTASGEPSHEVIAQQLTLTNEHLASEQQMSIVGAYVLQAIALETKNQLLSH
ncbi:hypothetical protein [Thalassotalea euphylliae]|uniref:DUF1439 domain-containing protein n=1 Tax=Thalassotalea euphylliae TaxID=1655234 RepID=A0A3E0U0U8_9GAMM|nr:hypothetical protein [Thalassotalea euphylliae]REL30354.1 hypothetical protein DXX94_06310 [Thalassotalea euphylliae]